MITPLRRLMRYRLVIPILRGTDLPDYTARGVGIGVAVSLTPLVGIQMPIVAGIWSLIRLLRPNWTFNLVVALAWTWLTNVFTVPIVYYIFLQTGNLMLGRWDNLSAFEHFAARLDQILGQDISGIMAVWVYFTAMLDEWGLPLFVGCLPWMIGGGWLSYRWSHVYIERFKKARRERQARKAARKKAAPKSGQAIAENGR
ncbi:DUF2062 domain-containing protein [Nisaea sp.]|uniref:DUF2062 domain-containing protein n=1 Tax=Nisaea sp. TaxID=2024842 RepID=UPI0034553266